MYEKKLWENELRTCIVAINKELNHTFVDSINVELNDILPMCIASVLIMLFFKYTPL